MEGPRPDYRLGWRVIAFWVAVTLLVPMGGLVLMIFLVARVASCGWNG